ncbi:YukJ family protein [Clostridium sp. WILCCON 0269]|uniref:YukJ family protein n=1 Tax=Candidatus Clostridium eludens TaxID=3381663 RepID=A0ABW8SV84_9CLOT
MSGQTNQCYSAIKCRPLLGVPWNYQKSLPSSNVRQGYHHASPHYHLIVEIDNNQQYTIVINIESKDAKSPLLLYYIDENYKNDITSKFINTFQDKYKIIQPQCSPDGIALDYVKGNLFDHTKMMTEKYLSDGEDSLNEVIDNYVKSAISDKADIYVFGMSFSDAGQNNGVHDVHMNQGNESQYANEDGVYQDGGFFIYYPALNKWIAMFFAFQSQSFTTDEDGHRIYTC